MEEVSDGDYIDYDDYASLVEQIKAIRNVAKHLAYDFPRNLSNDEKKAMDNLLELVEEK